MTLIEAARDAVVADQALCPSDRWTEVVAECVVVGSGLRVCGIDFGVRGGVPGIGAPVITTVVTSAAIVAASRVALVAGIIGGLV